MHKLIFLYDKLMTTKEQGIANLDMEFISYAQLQAKAYWINDNKKKRIFVAPSKGVSTKLVYGGIFLLKNYEENKYKIHSYYNSSTPFTNTVLIEDIYMLDDVKVMPIKFKSLRELQENKYIRGNITECSSFVGNPSNQKIIYNMSRAYYKINNVDKDNFIQLIKERRNVSE